MSEHPIRAALVEKGMTQKRLALLMGCSEPLVSQIIAGRVMPTYQRAVALERHLGIPVAELMAFSDQAATAP